LPWLDRSGSREWKGRRRVLGAFTAGGVAVVTLTLLGARDSPAPRSTAWNVRELAGAALVDTEGCRRCHAADGMAAPIVAGRIGRAADWLAVHVADPEVIGPGIRPVPPANDQEVTAILAALARMRGGPPPGADEATARVYLTVNRFCLACHTIGGVGGREGPNLTTVGRKLDARAIERRMINPKAEQPDAEMPAFAGKLTPDEIREVARWLAAQK
jgi:nitric oxide reductase subunit C